MSGAVRNATHAGSWYTDNGRELNKQLSDWLAAVPFESSSSKPVKAIISPHAGYSYCGNTAAYAYKQIAPEGISTVIVLGPSHVVCLNGCALSNFSCYHTPIGDLPLDKKVNAELRETGLFDTIDVRSEESEHSIEMQLPFIAKIMEKKLGSFGIVPVLVGSVPSCKQVIYGKIFAKYLADPSTFIVISSDFCHWGHRFHFAPYTANTDVPIYEQIAFLDRQGMDVISRLQPNAFNDYLKKTQNTICGRNPISILLNAIDYIRQKDKFAAEFRFLRYSQSNQCNSVHDSSVSYAAGVLYLSSLN